MYSLLFLGLTSFALSLLLTPLVRSMAWRFGFVDQPDQRRKVHASPIPRLGGVAIFASVVGAYLLLLVVRLSSRAILWEDLPLILRLFPAFSIVFGVGLVDDILSLRPWKRLAAESVAAMLVWFGGIHISVFAGYSVHGTVVSFLVTVLWIVTCTNAINLIDGVDGLAAGVSLFAAGTMLVAALLDHNFPMVVAVAPLVGALLGFLRYNFSPASIFLGDSGSLTIGFLLGCFGALWSEKSTTLLGLTAPLMVLAVPLLDVAVAVLRRLLRGEPIFAADRAHIHHKLLSRGLSPRQLVLAIYGICAVGSTSSILLIVNHNQNRDFVIVLVCLAAWLGLQPLGYHEFNAARRVVLGGNFRSVLSAQLALDAFEREIHPDMTLGESWDVLCRACPHFGFSGVVLDLDNEKRQWGSEAGWQARIDFPGHGYIQMWRAMGANSQGAGSVVFIDCVLRTFNQKLSKLQLAINE